MVGKGAVCFFMAMCGLIVTPCAFRLYAIKHGYDTTSYTLTGLGVGIPLAIMLWLLTWFAFALDEKPRK